MEVNIMSCRLVHEKSIEYQPVSCASDVMQIVKQIDELIAGAEEYVYLLCLTVRGDIAGIHEVGHGDINSAIVSPRSIFVRALLNNASAILLVHNHPSGKCEPSNEDRQITDRIKKAGEIMGIQLLDHIIVGGGDFFSFKANDLL